MLRFLRFWAFATGDPEGDGGLLDAPRLMPAKDFKSGLSGLVAVGAGSEAT